MPLQKPDELRSQLAGFFAVFRSCKPNMVRIMAFEIILSFSLFENIPSLFLCYRALTKHILHSCVQWYSGMVPFIQIFHISGPTFLPADYVFPKDLETWLSIPGMDAASVQASCERYLYVTSRNFFLYL